MSEKLDEIEVKVAEVVNFLRITGVFAPALREVVERKVTAEEAKKEGLAVSTEELQESADAFRLLYDMSKATDTNNWLKSIGVSVEDFEEHLETNVLISKFKDELASKADKNRYLVSPDVEEFVGKLIYQDWLESVLK